MALEGTRRLLLVLQLVTLLSLPPASVNAFTISGNVNGANTSQTVGELGLDVLVQTIGRIQHLQVDFFKEDREGEVEREVLAREVQRLREELEAFNATTRKCEVEGEHHVNEDCTTSVCFQGHLRPYQGYWASNFSELEASNCLYLEKSFLTWAAARTNCVALGGDLFVDGDIQAAKDYLEGPHGFGSGMMGNAWVGIRSKVWVDGRPLFREEWSTHEPDYDDGCGYVITGVWTYNDDTCNKIRPSLCRKGVLYP